MATATDTAVGRPPAANLQIYPFTARGNVTDNYFGTKVEDPYRWLENLGSPQVHDWVNKENALTLPALAAIPQRIWLKKRLTQLWNYERFGTPVKFGGHYFYLHNDGTNQSVLLVSDTLDGPERVLFDPNAVSTDATIALTEFTPSPQGEVVGYALSDGGTDWQVWHFRRVSDGAELGETLRFTKFWGISWARDGSGVYYSRYPSSTNGRPDDAGPPGGVFPPPRNRAGPGHPRLRGEQPPHARARRARHRRRALPHHHLARRL